MENAITQKLLNRREAAAFLGVKASTLEVWACHGRPALRYIRVGGAVRYRESDLIEFLTSRTATSATAHAAALATA